MGMRGLWSSSGIVVVLATSCNPDFGGIGESANSVGFSSSSPGTSETSVGRPDGSTGSTGSTVSTTTDSTTAGSSTGPSEGSSTTGEPPPWPTGEFDEPTSIEMLNSEGNDDDPSLTEDMLEIVFNSDRESNEDIFVSTRSSLDDPWLMPEPLVMVNSPQRENTPEISRDGLVLMFGSTRMGDSNDWDIYVSYRPARDQDWSDPVLVEDLSSPAVDFSPTLTVEMERIYVCSTRDDGSGEQDIWSTDVRTLEQGSLSVGALEPVPGLNSSNDDCTVSLSPDRRVIFFDSYRSGDYDLFMATRDEPGQDFGNVLPMGELNERGAQDMDPWISRDGAVIYFSSTRDGNGQDLFLAER